MENKKGSGVFLGVIGVATLLVAIIGATFAYFSATIAGTDQTLATGATLQLGYGEETKGLKFNLIPSADEIAEYSVTNEAHMDAKGQCKDDNMNDICSVYDFTIGNPSFTTAQNVYGTLTVGTNELPDLWYRIYEVTTTTVENPDYKEGGAEPETITKEVLTQVVAPKKAPLTAKSDPLTELNQTLLPSSLDAENGSFAADKPETYTQRSEEVNGVMQYNKRTYRIVMWIHETGENQTEEHKAKNFTAAISFTSGNSKETGVTGVIAAAQKTEPSTSSTETAEPSAAG